MLPRLAAVLLSLFQSGASPAAPPNREPRVMAVVLPAGPNPSLVDALLRLRGEAASLGFEVRFIPIAPDGDPLAHMKEIAASLSPAAVVGLAPTSEGARNDGTRSLTLYFLDRARDAVLMRQLDVEGTAEERADVVLAVRVLDFIRARMFDSLVDQQGEHRPGGTPANGKQAHDLKGRMRVSAGLDVLGSSGGFPLSVLPSLEVGYRLRPWLRLGASAAGLGPEGDLDGPPGQVSIAQQVGLALATLQFPTWWRLQASTNLGVGVYHVSVSGLASSGYLGHQVAAWTPALRLGAGLSFIIVPHVFIDLSGGALLFWHRPAIYSAGSEVAHTGRPAWQASTHMGVSF